jgi:hypothetical protein
MAATISGDAGNLQEVILSEYNDKTGKFIEDTDLILYLNRIHRLVAEKGIFVTTETFDSVTDQYIYDLATVLDETYIQLLDLTWEGETYSEPMHGIANIYDFKKKRRILQSNGASSGQPYIYTMYGTKLKVWPAPSASTSDAFEADYAYQPDDIEDNVSYTFPSEVISTWYPVYEYGALWLAFNKSAPSPKSKALAQENYALFQEYLNKWKGSQRLRGNITVRPG